MKSILDVSGLRCHPYLAVTQETDLRMGREVVHEVLSVTDRLGFLYSHIWTRTLEEGLCGEVAVFFAAGAE